MHHRVPLAPLALLALPLGPPALAQEPVTTSGVEVAWLPGLGAGSFSDGAVGDLDGDGQPDAVVLRGGEAFFAHGVDVFTNLVSAGTGIHAVALVGDDPAAPEGFAATTDLGLDLYTVDSSTGTIVVTGTPLAAGLWAGAVDVQRADWNGDGAVDLVGLAADRAQVLVLPRAGLGWGATEAIPVPETIRSFQPVQWGLTDAELEIALVNTANAVKVYDGDGGGPLYTRGNPLGVGRMTVLPDAVGLGYDRVVFYMGTPTGSLGYLVVFGHDGTDTAIAFPGEVPYALSAGDVVGDSRPDLAITFESQADALIAENVSSSSGATFNPSDPDATFYLRIFEELDLQPVEGANHAALCFGDVDGDGRTDLLLPSDAAQGAVLAHGTFGPLTADPLARRIVKYSSSACVDTGPAGLARLTFDFSYSDPSSDIYEFQLAVFHQAGPGVYVDAEAISCCISPQTIGQSYHADVKVHLPPYSAAWNPSNPNIFHVVVRPLDNEGRPVDASLVATFALDGAGLAGIEAAPGWEEGPDPYDELLDCGSQDPNDPGGNPTGGFLAGMRMPPLPPGDVPIFAATCLVP